MQSVVWYLLGAFAAVVSIVILIPFRVVDMRPARRWRLPVAGFVLLLPLVAAWLLQVGKPGAADIQHGAEDAVGNAEAANPSAANSDIDWSTLAHVYLGGPPPGSAANADTAPATTRAQLSASQLEATVKREPKNAAAWLALAQARRVAREFAPAVVAYEAALKLDAGSADAWADYADALASTGNRTLAGKPADAIKRALALRPTHAKALWLSASLELEQHRYSEALARWQQLRAVLPDSSPDIAVIDANIQEAQQLLVRDGASTSAARPAASAGSASPAAIAGTVDIDPRLAGKIHPAMTLFIFARSEGGQGPPLAVTRLSTSTWPVRFHLDDSQSMLPELKLSSVARARVEARISLTGNATAQVGDFATGAQLVPTRGGGAVALIIRDEVR